MPLRRYAKGKKRAKKYGGARIAAFCIFSLFALLAAFLLGMVDKRLLPAVIKIEEYRINSRLNQAIDAAIFSIVDMRGGTLTSSDFYIKTEDKDGKILSLSADTILINEICASVSALVGEMIEGEAADHISIPIGTLLGVEWLANMGPSYRISVMPVGASNVSHHTSFQSVGINQINFQVWIIISTQMQIVNPLQVRELDVTREVPLVNTVFTGEIPNVYFDGN